MKFAGRWVDLEKNYTERDIPDSERQMEHVLSYLQFLAPGLWMWEYNLEKEQKLGKCKGTIAGDGSLSR